MNDGVKRILQLICGAAMTVLGILVLCYDQMFILFCALALIIYGIGTFLSWTVHRKTGTASRGSFWIAVVTIAAGSAIFVGGTFLRVTAWLVMLILGICFIVSGIFEIIGAVIYRKAMTSIELGVQAPGSKTSIVVGGVMIGFGLFMVFAPLFAMQVTGLILAIAMILGGVRTVVSAFTTGAVSTKEESA